MPAATTAPGGAAAAAGLLALLILIVPTSTPAQQRGEGAAPLALGLRVGGVYSMLDRPSDPAGAPTVLHGSGFVGWSFVAGLSAELPRLVDLGPLRVSAEVDVLYSHHDAQGFAVTADGSERRRITLTTQFLRLPVLAWLSLPVGASVGLGLGPELLVGLGSDADLHEEGVPEPSPPLATTPVTHLGLAIALRADFLRGKVRVPVELRLVFDPFVGATSRERLRGYRSLEDPGLFELAFDRQLLVMLGFGYTL